MTTNRGDRRATIQARASALAGAQPRTVRAATDASDDTGTAPKTAELWLYGVVGGWWFGFDSESVADALRGLDVDKITVRLHSPGGNAMEGIAIGNLLRNHKASVTVVVDGLAASAASVIALAGDEIVMSPGSQYMLHDPWMLTVGNAAELRSDASFLDKQADNYAGIYASRAGGKASDWREVMLADDGRGTWYTADEAVTAGLADRVGTVTSTTPPPPEPSQGPDVDDDEANARAAWDLEVLVHPAARAAWNGPSTGRTPKPPTASADGSITTQEGSPAVAFSDEQVTNMRQKLGVAEDADEATILAALDEALSEQAETTVSVPEGMTLIESSVLDELRSGAQQGVEARRQQQAEARDRAIEAAIQAGKTTPARREHWAKAWDADPDGTRTLLDSLEAGLVPLSEVGAGGDVEAGESTADDALYASVFGDEKKGA